MPPTRDISAPHLDPQESRPKYLEAISRSDLPRLLFTTKEVAAVLAISETKVFEILRRGELESVRLGSCRRIPSDALEEFVAGLRAEASGYVPFA